MKKINDENIKEAFKKCNPYQIKTSSTQILEAYNRAKEEKTNNRKARNIIILAPLILCSSLILVFTMYGIKKSNTKNSFDYSKNKYFTRQLLTFTSFFDGHEDIYPLNKNRKNSLSDTSFSQVVDNYEKVQAGVKDLFTIDSYYTEVSKCSFTFDDVIYTRRIDYYSSSSSLVSSFYYNEEEAKNKKFIEEGLFVYLQSYYYASIEIKQENNKNKSEIEVSTILRNVDVQQDNKLYLIEKESEYKGTQSENSYSLMTFNSYTDLEDEACLSSIEYEIENEVINVSYQNGSEEFEFEDIKKLEENKYSFEFEEENDESNSRIYLTYNQDLSRTYSLDDKIIIKK